MKYTTILAVAMIPAMFTPILAFAGDHSAMEAVLQSRISSIESEGNSVFYSDIGEITPSPNISYFFELDPGYYIFAADGGEGILDLDMYVYDEDGYELASDMLDDNWPICEVTLDAPTEVTVEVAAYSFAKGIKSEYFCIVAAGEPSQTGKDPVSPGTITVDGIIDYWENYAHDQGYNVLFTESGVLNHDNPDTFELDLERGNYEIAVESIHENDDVDLYIYDESGNILISDTAPDNYPICSFEIRTAQTITAKVMPVTYTVGGTTEYAIVLSAEGGGTIDGFPTLQNYDTSVPLTEEADAEFIASLLGDYMDMLIDRNFQNIYDETGVIKQGETIRIPITLGRGSYMVYGHGGLRILDMDLRVYDKNGYIVAEDTLLNNSPLCEFSTQESAMYEIEIDGYEMVSPWNQGNYLLVIARK